jgi:hypothetical protein
MMAAVFADELLPVYAVSDEVATVFEAHVAPTGSGGAVRHDVRRRADGE